MGASAPRIDPARTVSLKAARHPLLVAQSWKDAERAVVPIDLELSPERPLLMITGPNAGGKTIALKTLALCVLMAQVGCHVPTAEGSRLPVFERLYAIIGDEQSVAENLSTFSAFVKQIREVLADADGRSQGHRSADAARLSQLLAQLDEATRCEAERTILMERRESETAARLAAAREAEADAATRARETVERAKAEAAK